MKTKLTLVLSLILCAALSSSAKKPNVIMIMVDDFGYETLGCNGSADYKTPVLDNMAKNGIRFEHCYAQPLCTPSRVKLMTGISNVRNYVAFGKLDRKRPAPVCWAGICRSMRRSGALSGIRISTPTP